MEEVRSAFLVRALLCTIAIPVSLAWLVLIGWTLEAARHVDVGVLARGVGGATGHEVDAIAAAIMILGPLAATWATLLRLDGYVATKKGEA